MIPHLSRGPALLPASTLWGEAPEEAPAVETEAPVVEEVVDTVKEENVEKVSE